MCDEAVHNDSFSLELVPHDCKTYKMCAESVLNESHCLKFIPDCFKIQQMCRKAVRKAKPTEICSWSL